MNLTSARRKEHARHGCDEQRAQCKSLDGLVRVTGNRYRNAHAHAHANRVGSPAEHGAFSACLPFSSLPSPPLCLPALFRQPSSRTPVTCCAGGEKDNNKLDRRGHMLWCTRTRSLKHGAGRAREHPCRCRRETKAPMLMLMQSHKDRDPRCRTG